MALPRKNKSFFGVCWSAGALFGCVWRGCKCVFVSCWQLSAKRGCNSVSRVVRRNGGRVRFLFFIFRRSRKKPPLFAPLAHWFLCLALFVYRGRSSAWWTVGGLGGRLRGCSRARTVGLFGGLPCSFSAQARACRHRGEQIFVVSHF